MTGMKLELKEIPGGTVLHVRVKPGSRKNEILGVQDGALKLGVVARPFKGKANLGVIKLLAKLLDLAPTSIELVSGNTSRDKTVLVPLTKAQLTKKLRG
jgi:uncharacterized protein (TIGR00251 family)